jgi:hypothetical protein
MNNSQKYSILHFWYNPTNDKFWNWECVVWYFMNMILKICNKYSLKLYVLVSHLETIGGEKVWKLACVHRTLTFKTLPLKVGTVIQSNYM